LSHIFDDVFLGLLSSNMMEHGMDMIVEGWYPCFETCDIFQMMGTLSMMMMMSLLKVKKEQLTLVALPLQMIERFLRMMLKDLMKIQV